MLPVSALSNGANNLRNLLLGNIDDLIDIKQIKIGHPKDTLEEMKKDLNNLNLFFYNVTYDGYPADGLSTDPFYVKLHCLITPVGAKKEGSASPGENDLRLIGEVMRVLHEHPIISVNDSDSNEVAQLQIVPHPLSLDNLNHIWSTQGDTAYRLSVAYEMSLAPIPLAEAVEQSLRVGEIGIRAQANMNREPLPPEGFGIKTSAPIVPGITVDVKKTDWSPHICFMNESNNSLAYTHLISKTELPETGYFQMKVLIAGKSSSEVDLIWETWDSTIGWKKFDTSQKETIETETIDPDNFSPDPAIDINLPIKDKGQATLYAERAWKRLDGSTVTVRSNPLLVTVYEAKS